MYTITVNCARRAWRALFRLHTASTVINLRAFSTKAPVVLLSALPLLHVYRVQ
jgi:hypothetical protein